MLVNIRGKGLWSAPFSALAGSRDHSIAQLEGKSSAQARARPYFGCTCKMQNRMASWIINLPLKFGHITSPFLRPQTKTLLTTSSGEAFAIQRGKQWKNKFEAAWCRMHKARAKRHIMLQIDTCRLQVWLFRLFGRCSWPCFSNPLFFRRATFQCNLSFNSPSLFLSLSLFLCVPIALGYFMQTEPHMQNKNVHTVPIVWLACGCYLTYYETLRPCAGISDMSVSTWLKSDPADLGSHSQVAGARPSPVGVL